MPNLNVNKNGLTPEQAEVITQTLPVVGANIEKITPNFYNRMFAAHPELIADTFNRGNQKQGAQQKALAASVATFAATLVDPDAPAPEELLSRIGHKHISVGIKPEQYPIVHKHLFDAIEEILTPEVFQGAVRDAWDAVYLEMQRVLINFEKGLYDDLGVEAGDVFRAAHVVSREERGDDVAVFSVKLDDEAPVSYLPGQYISVRQTMPDGAGQLRQYSLVGGEEGVLTFAVRRVDASEDLPAGEVSTQLWEKVQPGDAIEISLPAGDLVLDTKSDDPVVLISAGIGATPMIGMLDALVAADSKRDVVVLHADRAENTDALRAERNNAVSALANARQQVWYEPDLMNLADTELPEGAQFYLCGGNGFLQAIRQQLADRGIDRNNVHFELFSPNDWLLDA
ncbi:MULTISPECIES: globin domain-containing protein [unclassified Corynebacterium]|uniref:globin domain-containing protein n=1 Tax=unclassified Corynebacterium TaxID=2624378 RepID=UPI0008A18EF1|nr:MULTISPECIES: globin domain-containing protein [unclassified Corynebacterium]MBC6832454.1 hemin transporter [Corynebacterium sp. LK29]OFL12848.1 hemin transporter [Corynebacterium sp. HMSC063F04]OHR37613.1 hemin transporter [Corynebacterium sp. HMSC075F02]